MRYTAESMDTLVLFKQRLLVLQQRPIAANYQVRLTSSDIGKPVQQQCFKTTAIDKQIAFYDTAIRQCH